MLGLFLRIQLVPPELNLMITITHCIYRTEEFFSTVQRTSAEALLGIRCLNCETDSVRSLRFLTQALSLYINSILCRYILMLTGETIAFSSQSSDCSLIYRSYIGKSIWQQGCQQPKGKKNLPL